MNALDTALELAKRGFYVFPLKPNAKTPAVSDWQSKATKEQAAIRALFSNPAYNVGIYTGRFDDGALVVIDIDNKNGKNGDATIFQLELEGKEFPATLEVTTPSGGRHLFYRSKEPRKQGAEVFGAGVDVRSQGGYVVAAGSVLGGVCYHWVDYHHDISACPQWVLDTLSVARSPSRDTRPVEVNEENARARALEYLATAPVSYEGAAGDETAFKVAAAVKDFGVDEDICLELLLDHWNNDCVPPWSEDELVQKVHNAYHYGKKVQGAASPEADFPVVDGVEESEYAKDMADLNKSFAIVDIGGSVSILREKKDKDGVTEVVFMGRDDFAMFFANKRTTLPGAKSSTPIAKAWLEYPKRRTYDDLTFDPSGATEPNVYNMWKGFRVKAADTSYHPMVERWKEHALENICRGDKALCHWLMCYLAHLVQKPHEKPQTALVFKGGKGVGKNALIERVTNSLLGKDHAMVFSNKEHLFGKHNAHLSKCLMAVLDEAVWSGDKANEGKLKDLVTGDKHVIEPKFASVFTVKNLTRVVLISNEEWVVPASNDERRFAVFNVGDGRKQDTKYFKEMRVGIDEQGGAAHLLRFLLDYEITESLDSPPNTEGLAQQKVASLDDVSAWWMESLQDGSLVGGTRDTWPEYISRHDLCDAVSIYYKKRGIRSRVPTFDGISRTLAHAGTLIECKKLSQKYHSTVGATYGVKLPTVVEARAAFDKALKMTVDWGE